VQKEFADYREAAALKFVSDRDLVQIENRFSSLVENIQHDIRGMAERLDRVSTSAGCRNFPMSLIALKICICCDGRIDPDRADVAGRRARKAAAEVAGPCDHDG
jgi:hypothetical protein